MIRVLIIELFIACGFLYHSVYHIDLNVLNRFKPQNLALMISLAEVLSAGFPELRVDFYEINGKVYFGELTFHSDGGFDNTITREADAAMGEKLKLPIDA